VTGSESARQGVDSNKKTRLELKAHLRSSSAWRAETVAGREITHDERLSDTAIARYPEFMAKCAMNIHGAAGSLPKISGAPPVAFLVILPGTFQRYSGHRRNRAHRRCQVHVVGYDTKFGQQLFTSDDDVSFIPYTTAGDLWDARYASVMLFEPVSPILKPTPCSSSAPPRQRQHFSPSDKRAITNVRPRRVKPIYEGITLGIEAHALFVAPLTLGIGGVRCDEYHARLR